MINSNKKEITHFRDVLPLIKVAFVATMLLANTVNASAAKAYSSIEGVWEFVSTTALGVTESTPLPTQDGSTLQTYFCFSNGKLYGVSKVTGSKNPAEDGLYKGADWGKPYTYLNNTLTLDENSFSFVITGNTAIIESGYVVIKLQRVNSPSVEEIKSTISSLPNKKRAKT